MKILGLILISLAFVHIVVLLGYFLDIIKINLTFYDEITSALHIFVMIVLGVLCTKKTILAWRLSLWYFSIMILYFLIYDLVETENWDAQGIIELSIAPLFYGVLLRLFLNNSVLAEAGLKKPPIIFDYISMLSIIGALFVIVSYVFGVLISIFFIIVLAMGFVIRKRNIRGESRDHP